MQGYQVTFYTHQDKKHGHLPLAEWLLQEAKKLGAPGATMIAAEEGFGHHRKLHAARFFELGDQPVEVVMALGEQDVEHLFQRLRDENIRVFYVKSPIEFGTTGD